MSLLLSFIVLIELLFLFISVSFNHVHLLGMISLFYRMHSWVMATLDCVIIYGSKKISLVYWFHLSLYEKKIQVKFKEDEEGTTNTLDGSVDMHGRPAIRAKSGRWVAGIIILGKHRFLISVLQKPKKQRQRKLTCLGFLGFFSCACADMTKSLTSFQTSTSSNCFFQSPLLLLTSTEEKVLF